MPFSYSQKLQDDRWHQKATRVRKKYDWKCVFCKDHGNQVHHLIYIEGREPWEYRDEDLICLCDYCHSEHHENYGIITEIQRGKRATTHLSIPIHIAEIMLELPIPD
ncbi:MAG: hypothetical protein KGL39_18020 [Patescibacteria group bacterium]|nr:hypothetical protein [Patescibacteria group bacterium]